MTAATWPSIGQQTPSPAELRRQALADVYSLLIEAGRAQRAAREVEGAPADGQDQPTENTEHNGA